MALVAQQTGFANSAAPALFGKAEGLRTAHVGKNVVAKKLAAKKVAVARRARCTLAPRYPLVDSFSRSCGIQEFCLPNFRLDMF